MNGNYINDNHRKNQIAVCEYLSEQRQCSPKDMEQQTHDIQEMVITQKNISQSHSLKDILDHKVADEDVSTQEGSNDNVIIEDNVIVDDASCEILPSCLLESIQTCEWPDQSIDELGDIVKQVQSGKILIRRFTKGELQCCTKNNEILIEASAILAVNQKYDINGMKKSLVERVMDRELQGPMQEKILESWAKKECLWMNDYMDNRCHKYKSLENLLQTEYKPSMYGGSEADVYWGDDGNSVIKAISLSHADNNPQMLLDRIMLDNAYFPAIAMEIIGFGRDVLGHFKVIIKQHFVKGTYPTKEEIRRYASLIGLTINGGWWYSPDRRFRVTDLSSLNIMKTDIGELAVFDCDFEMLMAPKGLAYRYCNNGK
jgi:hypothetical protein